MATSCGRKLSAACATLCARASSADDRRAAVEGSAADSKTNVKIDTSFRFIKKPDGVDSVGQARARLCVCQLQVNMNQLTNHFSRLKFVAHESTPNNHSELPLIIKNFRTPSVRECDTKVSKNRAG